jgi:hypothetical protein
LGVLYLEVIVMCRNIKVLFNFDPPVTSEEIRAASLQFVRKISGFNAPSKANEGALLAAVDEIAGISTHLLRALKTSARPRIEDKKLRRRKLAPHRDSALESAKTSAPPGNLVKG